MEGQGRGKGEGEGRAEGGQREVWTRLRGVQGISPI